MGVMTKLSAGAGRRRAARAAAAVLGAGVVAAGLVTAGLAGAGAGAATAAAAGSRASASRGTVLAAGLAGARPAVPWWQVGPGWVLAEYWNGRFPAGGKPAGGAPAAPKPVAAPAILYLVDPAGRRYELYRTASTTSPPDRVDWSGDKARALLRTAAGGVEQVTLATGAVSTPVKLAGHASVIGYTRPDGLNLLGSRWLGTRQQLARYSLTGAVTKILATGPDAGAGEYTDDGTALAVGAARGLQLVSNSGAVIRSLPVAGTSCSAVRWWNHGTILASCLGDGTRMWLVPAGGGRPRVLSLERPGDAGDLGDVGAWHLAFGLYFQALGPCGTLQIFRQQASGSVALVTVPHSSGNNRVLGAFRGQLLVQAPTGCGATAGLLWFNPSTRHERMLLSSGVLGAVPYGRS
jgi:hypothetical protein